MQQVLLSAQIGRRQIGVVVFRGLRLEHAEIKQLSSNAEIATRSVLSTIRRLVEDFEAHSLALESWNHGKKTRAEQCQNELAATVREQGVPVLEIEHINLLESAASQPLKTRHQLRSIALSIWPVLSSSPKDKLVCDAALLGLFVQVERLLSVIPT